MWIRAVQWRKGTAVVSLPRDVVRTWRLDGSRHVVMTLEEGGLRIRPLTDQDVLQAPLPAREGA
jgi:hypothetical protein